MATKTKKAPKTKKVQKALAPEEKTVIENIAALAGQLIAAGGSEEVVMAEHENEEEEEFFEEDDEEVIKANEGPTANEKAEERVEDGTEITEGNLSEVGKRVGRSVIRQVNKRLAATQENTAMMQMLAEITKALKGISDRQGQSEQAISGILDGFGITKAVAEEAEKEVQKTAPRPIAQTDSTAILAELMSVVKGMQTTQIQQNRPAGWDVAKSSRDALREAGPLLLGLR